MKVRLGAIAVAMSALAGCPEGPSGYVFVDAWGGPGQVPGRFREPMGVDVDGQGFVYVADARNGRVQKLAPSGEPAMAFGVGELVKPVDVAAAPDGTVYAVDFDLDCVVAFAADGHRLRTWGGAGTGPGQFQAPAGITVDQGGRVYVADFYNHRVQMFDGHGRLLRGFGAEGTGPSQLHYPTDVAVDGSGRLVVADAYNYRVQRWTAKGAFQTEWGGQGSGPDQLDVPSGVAVDSRGVTHIADSGNRRMVARSVAGEVLAIWRLEGGDGGMHSPSRVAVHGDRVYLADPGGDRVIVLRFGGG